MLQKQEQISLSNYIISTISALCQKIFCGIAHPDGDLDNTPCQRRGGWGRESVRGILRQAVRGEG
jgi:hypothetical protein